ncbi:MAG: BspA family leucine-rich repeat surface protein [Prevotella sp.]
MPEWYYESDIQSNCKKVIFDETFKEVLPASCYSWFSSFKELQEIEGLQNLNTEDVTTMHSMFNGCSKLTSLDLSSFNTANVTTMSFMFYNCYSLNTIYVSDKFTTNKLNTGTSYFAGDSSMFDGCTSLKGAAPYKSDYTGKSMANYNTGYFKTYYKLGDEEKVELYRDKFTVGSLGLSDDKNFVAHAPFKANSVSYSRNNITSDSKWYTLCLPFAYNTPTNFTAYQLKSATSNSVEIEEITGEIAAGTPIIFKFKDDADKNIYITKSNADIENDPGMASTTEGNGCQLFGTYQKKIFSSQDYNTFIIYKDKLMNPAKMLQNNRATTVGLKPFHAYMTMTSQTSAKSFSIGSGDEETTVIDLLNSVATDDAEYYDINGRRIDAPVKGVNIVRRGNKTMKLIIK